MLAGFRWVPFPRQVILAPSQNQFKRVLGVIPSFRIFHPLHILSLSLNKKNIDKNLWSSYLVFTSFFNYCKYTGVTVVREVGSYSTEFD